MAQVINAYRLYDEPQTAEESWNESDRTTAREYTRTWQAVTDVATSDSSIIALSSYLPAMFSSDPDNPDAGVIRRRIERTKNNLRWNADITYSTRAPSQQDGDDNGSPLGAKVKWSRSSQQINVPIWEDVSGEAILNSAGLPFNPPVNVVRFNATYRAIRCEAVYPNESYEGRVNSTNFLGKPPGTLLCAIPSIEEEFSGALKYYRITYEFHYDYRGWQPRLLNAGFLQWNDDKSAHTQIKDANGENVTEPWPLDENGVALSSATVLAGSGATFTDVDGYLTADFNALGLNLP